MAEGITEDFEKLRLEENNSPDSRVDDENPLLKAKIKFVIIVPMKVTHPNTEEEKKEEEKKEEGRKEEGKKEEGKKEEGIKEGKKEEEKKEEEQVELAQCQNFLDKLKGEAFEDGDSECLKDIAVIFGLNGKHSDGLRQFLDKMIYKTETTELMYEKIALTWGPRGDIAYKGKQVPYVRIRENLKDNQATEQLVERLRGEDTNTLIYFSFIDADIVDFNQVYSSYRDLVQSYCRKVGSPPTVMSTGYELPGQLKNASQVDREIRIATAKHLPLGTYYPEANFCVLLPDGKNTLPESFQTRGGPQRMESRNLIANIKRQRPNSTFIFPEGKPIITSIPSGKKTGNDSLNIRYSHFKPRTWAMSACIYEETDKEEIYLNKVWRLAKLLTVSDEEFDEYAQKIKGPEKSQLLVAAQDVREIRRNVLKKREEVSYREL